MEPLTPEDIAEVVVFAATRRENVVIADTLIFPQHQVSIQSYESPVLYCFQDIEDAELIVGIRLHLDNCTRSRHKHDADSAWSLLDVARASQVALQYIHRKGRTTERTQATSQLWHKKTIDMMHISR